MAKPINRSFHERLGKQDYASCSWELNLKMFLKSIALLLGLIIIENHQLNPSFKLAKRGFPLKNIERPNENSIVKHCVNASNSYIPPLFKLFFKK